MPVERRFPSLAGMNLTLARCFVQVSDPDLALTFYRNELGLELRNDVARDGFRWITVGAATQPDVAIVLTNYLNGSPADSDAVAALIAKGALNGVHFHTDDLDATFEKYAASGAEIVQEPTEQPWARGTVPCVTRPVIWCASTSHQSCGLDTAAAPRPSMKGFDWPGRPKKTRTSESPKAENYSLQSWRFRPVPRAESSSSQPSEAFDVRVSPTSGGETAVGDIHCSGVRFQAAARHANRQSP